VKSKIQNPESKETPNPESRKAARFGIGISALGFVLVFGFWILGFPRAVAGPTQSPPPPPVVQDNVTVDAKTERVIRGALKFLATKQTPNGSWNAGGGEHAVAMTAYTLMAYLAAGNTPNEGEYGKAVNRGMQYLLDRVGADGYISTPNGSSNMYGHGIATIALGELYGMSRDPRLNEKLEKAVHLIESCQNDQGGWRYAPRKSDADLSVTVLQVVSLRVAKNSGIDVSQQTIDKAVRYVRTCYDKQSGGFTYQPRNRQPGFARTAAGIYCLQVCGLYDDPMVATGSRYLLNGLDGGPGNMHEWFTYGHFYAAPAQYMIGGDTWRTWYLKVSKLLLDNVHQEGEFASWEPIDHKVGTVYATAVYTMILAMPYHYVPLYQR
jgi:hypothetical protein